MGTLAGANLTHGKGGIGGRYADEDFVRALTHGVRKDGRSVVYMPSQEYHFGADDLAAIVAFLRSLPPVDRELPRPRVGVVAAVMTAFGDLRLLPAEHIDHARLALPPSALAPDPVKAGEQLVAKAGCRACHGPHFEGGFGPPPGAANLTPVGIGGWTEADFFAALRRGVRPNGARLAETMPRTLGAMEDSDLRRIFAYLQTLAPAGTKTRSQS
jgi:cytochrome c553